MEPKYFTLDQDNTRLPGKPASGGYIEKPDDIEAYNWFSSQDRSDDTASANAAKQSRNEKINNITDGVATAMYGDNLPGKKLQTMPVIPSASAQAMSGWGRNGDTTMAHVAPGETFVPQELIAADPALKAAIEAAFLKHGADPSAYVVGSPTGSYNPVTGQQEFFLKSVKKALGKIAGSSIGKILIPVAASVLLPGIGTGLSAGMSAALGSAAATKLGGGSWGEALLSGAGSYVGGQLLGGTGPSIGGILSQGGNTLNALAGSIPASIAGTTVGSIAGSMIGSNLGQTLGANMFGSDKSIAPAKASGWGSSIATNAPQSTPAPSLALPGDNQSAVSAPVVTEGPSKGAGDISPVGVSYLTSIKNRNTGDVEYQSSAFGSNFGTGRRGSWGGGVTFA